MSAINAALVTRFCAPEWALCFEVRDATGFRGEGRSADAVAVNCYPSRGLEIHGIEVKTARSDWLRELRSPQKSVAVQKYCDRWWVVTTPDIVQPGELPPTWGLLELKGGLLRQVTEAPKLPAKQLDRGFMASMLRNMAKSASSMVPTLVEEERKRLMKDADERVKYELERRSDKAGEIYALVGKIKLETGLDLTHWETAHKIIPAVRFALAADVHGYAGFKHMLDNARALVNAIDEHAPQYGIELKGKS